jgi:hypothetical protein
MVYIVRYKGEYYLWYASTSNGAAKLINQHGVKFSGTPSPSKLEIVEELTNIREFNGHRYVETKQGIFSLSTGNLVVDSNILKAFKDDLF